VLDLGIYGWGKAEEKKSLGLQCNSRICQSDYCIASTLIVGSGAWLTTT
jgi:hypothetical protein